MVGTDLHSECQNMVVTCESELSTPSRELQPNAAFSLGDGLDGISSVSGHVNNHWQLRLICLDRISQSTRPRTCSYAMSERVRASLVIRTAANVFRREGQCLQLQCPGQTFSYGDALEERVRMLAAGFCIELVLAKQHLQRKNQIILHSATRVSHRRKTYVLTVWLVILKVDDDGCCRAVVSKGA